MTTVPKTPLFVKNNDGTYSQYGVIEEYDYRIRKKGMYLMTVEDGGISYSHLCTVKDEVNLLAKLKRFSDILCKCISDNAKIKSSIKLTSKEQIAWDKCMSELRPQIRLYFDSASDIAKKAVEQFYKDIFDRTIEQLEE